MPRPEGCEHYATARARPGEPVDMVLRRLDEGLRERDALPTKLTVFASTGLEAAAQAGLRKMRGSGNCPITWVDGSGPDGGIAGVQAHAVSGMPLEPLCPGGCVTGILYADRWARYASLGCVRPYDLAAGRPAQARQVFLGLDAALRSTGMAFRHVARTWLFVDRILEWYGPLNQARTRFFDERGVFHGVLPASTGVGAGNPFGAALVAEAYAVQPLGPEAVVRAVPSPLQGAAGDYGSAFSRAIEVTTPDLRRLLVSGTSSVERGGETACVGDVEGQIELTLQVISSLLGSRQMGLADVARGVAYLPRLEDAPALECVLARRGLPAFPLVVAQASVCRDNLLFEIEVDAIATHVDPVSTPGA